GRQGPGPAGLVAGAEESGAVGGDRLVADVVRQLRRLLGPDHLLRRAEDDLGALVADALRLHVRTAHLARGVDMREEGDRRYVVVDGRGHRAGDVAVLVDRGVLDAELAQLLGEQAQQVELLPGARVAR